MTPLLRRHQQSDDSGYAIILVLMTMATSVIVLTGIVGVVMSELIPTAVARKRTQTLAAAEAGQGSAVTILRNAYSPRPGFTGVYGDTSELPCAPVTGGVPGGQNLTYSVTITYFTENPAGQSENWRASKAITCTEGSGPTTPPLYALLHSQAKTNGDDNRTNSLGNRSIETTYIFNWTSQPVVGGLLYTKTISSQLCLTAESVPPAPNSLLTLQSCNPGSTLQKLSYRSDYTIVLTDSQNTDGSGGMCLTQDPQRYKVIFTACGPLKWDPNNPTYINQRWAFNAAGQLQGLANDGKSLNKSACIDTYESLNASITTTSCSVAMNLNPSSEFGNGAIGIASQQLVNNYEYSHCVDIPYQDVTSTFLFDNRCQFDPTQKVSWSQRWIWDSGNTRHIQTTNNGNLYCLTTGSTEGAKVLAKTCSTLDLNQQWTQTGDTGNRSTSFNLVDTYGRCMSLGSSDASQPGYSTIVMERCNGTTRQKWNAPPSNVDGGIYNYRETQTK